MSLSSMVSGSMQISLLSEKEPPTVLISSPSTFAESEIVGTRKISCVSCVKLDPGMFNNPSSSFCSHKFYLDELCGCVCVVLYINDFTLAGKPKNIGGCSLCSENILHPAGGGYHSAQARSVRHAPGGLQISFKF